MFKHIKWIFFLLPLVIFSQDKFTISGVIKEKSNNENLYGVNVVIEELKTGVTTNEYGFYSITIPKGNYTLKISYIGFKNIDEKIELSTNVKRNFLLLEDTKSLDEVIVTDTKKSIDIKKPEMSSHKLSISAIKKIPVILGEVDIIKSLLLLPGVTNAGEGASGFNVRGGSADQNLILLDEATIFNSSHLFGFFSVFNPDAIKDLKLYKGGIPARFGGRLSSVLDIYQKDGNSNNFEVNGGIGLLASRILAEGPIVKGKSSFLVAGRSSYAHLFLKLTDNKNSAYFYDLNTKISYNFNDKNQLYFSGYFGRDVFSIDKSFQNIYGNSVFNLRWNHLFNNKLFANTSLIYSDYYYGLNLEFVGFNWDSGIKNYNFKHDLKYYLNEKTKIFAGFNSIYHTFNPGVISPDDADSSINYRQLDKKYAFENALYIDFEKEISKKLNVSFGVRYSLFHRLGNQVLNTYTNNQAVVFNNDIKIYEKATPIGTKSYGNNETIAQFDNFEPRASLSYSLNENNSIKLSYNRMAQYQHLITNTAAPTPL
ncbi:MAG: TonB-dependent receptor, partial [Flavobacterium sp.]